MDIILPLKEETYDEYIHRILNSRENKKDTINYQEKHHIIPRCLGGNDNQDNLIYLYAQEHYYAHKLLAEENPDNDKLQYAWWNMCHCKKEGRVYEVNASEYNEARIRFSKLMKENFSGENAYWYGKTQSEEANLKRSLTESGEGNPMYDKHHTQDVKDKISKINKGQRMGENHPRARAVKCINTGEIFSTAQEAANFYKLKNRSSITMNCSGLTKSAGKDPITKEKLLWEYVE